MPSNDQVINLNNLWRENSEGNKDQISLSVFGNAGSLTIFRKNGDRKPAFKMTISLYNAVAIVGILRKLKTATGPERFPYIPQSWDRNAKKYVSGQSLVFFRDNKNRFGFDAILENSESIKFYFSCAYNSLFSEGSEPLSVERKSEIGLDTLIVVLSQQLPLALLLNRMNPQQQPNGGFGNNGGNRAPRESNTDSGNGGGSYNNNIWE